MHKKSLKKAFLYVGLILITFLSISPLIWIFMAAFKTRIEIFSIPPVWIPKRLIVSNFTRLFGTTASRLPFIYNSLIISFVSMAVVMLLATMAAYGFAKFRIPRSKDIQFWILSTRMMPPIAAVIPIFLLFQRFVLLDTRLGMIMMYIAFNLPFAVWMLIIFFEQLPREIEEAAMIDGCSIFGLLRWISLPLIAPGLVVVAIFTFYFCWNEFLFALVLTGNVAKTFPVSIREFKAVSQIRWGPLAAAALIYTIPVIAITFIFQKYIVTGLTFGAVKR